ncbi:MAG: LptF/LptG family permease [Sphingomonadaceae bacterium]|nr:LptF/LptG family permease [Sphingomonadaceae bacterium]
MRLPLLDRYLFRLTIVPLFGTLVLAAMLLLIEKMLSLFDFVINEGGPVSVVWRMLGNLLPEYLGLGIPIGVMLGVLLAFRRLALSSELDAMRAVGLSFGRMLRVPLLIATAFAVVNFGIVGFLQPFSRYNYEELRYELRSGALGASIRVGEFARFGDRMTLRVEESLDGGRDLRGIFLRTADDRGRSLAVSAASGRFLRTDDPDTIILRVAHGTLVHDGPGLVAPRVLTFEQHDIPIPLPPVDRFRARGDGTLEMSIPELLEAAYGPDAQGPPAASAAATLHRRLVQCVVVFVVPFLAMALGVPPKRSTSSLGVFLSVILLVTYHKITEYGERMGAIGRVDPVLAQWLPFALFVGLCGWLYHVLAHRPGGQPIGALERALARAGRVLARLARRPLPARLARA